MKFYKNKIIIIDKKTYVDYISKIKQYKIDESIKNKNNFIWNNYIL